MTSVLYRQIERYLVWAALIIIAAHVLMTHMEVQAIKDDVMGLEAGLLRARNHINSIEVILISNKVDLAASTEIHKHLKEEIHETLLRINNIEKRHVNMDGERYNGKIINGIGIKK